MTDIRAGNFFSPPFLKVTGRFDTDFALMVNGHVSENNSLVSFFFLLRMWQKKKNKNKSVTITSPQGLT